jgi:hypothetical protein
MVCLKKAAALQLLLLAFLRTLICSTNQDSHFFFTSKRCFILLNMQKLRRSVAYRCHHPRTRMVALDTRYIFSLRLLSKVYIVSLNVSSQRGIV